jgi:hypothetical protein
MAAESDLARLLAGLRPVRHDGEWVFVRWPATTLPERALGAFREREGVSAIIERESADALGLLYDYVAAWIELQVNSDLAAVGLTAAVSRVLADAGISCNVVAALHHDHLFVPHDRADDALAHLGRLAGRTVSP